MNTMQYQSCLSCMSWMEKSDLLKYGVVNGIISQPLMGSSEVMLNASQQEVITHMTSDWLQTHPIRKAKNGRFRFDSNGNFPNCVCNQGHPNSRKTLGVWLQLNKVKF